jgi:hypothetical protein
MEFKTWENGVKTVEINKTNIVYVPVLLIKEKCGYLSGVIKKNQIPNNGNF